MTPTHRISLRHALVGCAFAVSSAVAPRALAAQLPHDSSSFVALNANGNGIAALRTTIRAGFSGRAAMALSAIAVLAGLNITYEPALPALGRDVSIAPRDRAAAVALLEIAKSAKLRMRVSPRGQIVVDSALADPVSRTSSPFETDAATPAHLASVRVTATRAERRLFESARGVSASTISAEALRAAPVFVEPDVLRAVQAMPGVQARSDWAAGFNIRGGESDQTLVMLDGYPIYNPFHLGGVFSTFIDPMIGGVTLHNGALPTRFGGRLSGVLDVRSATPTSSALGSTATLSLMSLSATTGKTFDDGNGGWMIGGRRTYADAIVDMVKSDGFPYHFQDLHAHVERGLLGGTRFSMTGYAGRDVIATTRSAHAEGAWGNQMIGATLGRTFNDVSRIAGAVVDSIAVEQRVSLSRFTARLGLPTYYTRGDNRVDDTRATGSISVYRQKAALNVGYEVASQALSYVSTAPSVDWAELIPVDSLSQRSRSAAIYGDVQWKPVASLLVDVGARLENATGITGLGVSPRASVKYFIGTNTALSVASGRYTQWLHSLGRAEEPMQPLQFWALSDSNRTASTASDIVVGAERWLTPSRMLHVGTFYKRYENLLTPNPFSDPHVSGDAFDKIRGASYGIDVLLRQIEGGPFTGWLSYSYALSAREDMQRVRYAPPQDRRHNLNLVGSWKRAQTTVGVRVNIGSGLPTTPMLAQYARNRYDPTTRRWVTNYYWDQRIMAPTGSERMPLYKRIDLSITRNSQLFGTPFKPFISVVNAANFRNPAGYTYDFGQRGTRASFPNFPLLPTFGATIGY